MTSKSNTQAKVTPLATPRDRFDAVRADLQAALLERDEVIDAMLGALVARQHVLLLGPPGTGKSYLANLLCQAVAGQGQGAYFQWLLSKFSTPEELFGPVSVAGLQADRFERVGKGKLQEAKVAFVDEIWKANSAILNSLLTIINERLYHDGTKGPVLVPLEQLVGASNELPQDEGLGALYDRFLVRLWVRPLKQGDAFKALLRGGLQSNVSTLHDGDLDTIRAESEQVKLDDHILDLLVQVRTELVDKGIRVSDRRWVAVVHYLQATAWMAGDQTVTDDHLEHLIDCCWDEPEQRAEVKRAVLRIANPVGAKVEALMDDARTRVADAPKATGDLGEDQKQLMALAATLMKIQKADKGLGPKHPRVVAAVTEITSQRKELLQQAEQLVRKAMGG